jgi:hypothetical protein
MYRQRFYLDWRTERGLHWRVAVIDFAKWPWMILASVEVVLARRSGYAITPKAGRPGIYWPFTVWNCCQAAAVALAWGIGQAAGTVGLALHIAAGSTVAASLALAASGLRTFPPPYQLGLWHPVDGPAPHSRRWRRRVGQAANLT